MKSNRAFIAASIVLLGAVASHAQPAAIQQLQNSQAQFQMPSLELRAGTNAPELYVGENDDIGPQRILKVNGQTAAAPPRRVMNSRRLMLSPKFRRRHPSGSSEYLDRG